MTIGTPIVIFAVLTIFWLFLTVFDDWYTVPIVKNSQNHWSANRHMFTKTVPTVYQQCTNRQKQPKDSQNSKNDYWCTNRHMSSKTVPTVYQSSKTVKRQSQQQKWPLVYQSSHVYTESAESIKSASASAEYTKPEILPLPSRYLHRYQISLLCARVKDVEKGKHHCQRSLRSTRWTRNLSITCARFYRCIPRYRAKFIFRWNQFQTLYCIFCCA